MGVSRTVSAIPAGIETQTHTIRNGLICACVFAVGLWAAHPVAEMGFIDDWSYIKTAQVFAQTGHLVYNGWATAMLGWQVPWGALFIKLFGFSFTVVRLSILPVAMATIALFHAILVRFGVNPQNAVLGTLTFALSPIFMPLAASFMTEVPGMFAIVLCLYLCQRAVAAGSSKATIVWLCLAVASNLVGGTARQIAWLGALVMVPSTGWLLRKRHGVLLISALLWVISVGGVFTCMQWWNLQPYSVPESPFKNFEHRPASPTIVCFELLGFALTLSLLVYPVLAAWLPQMRRLSRATLLRVALLTALFGVAQWITRWAFPWITDVIYDEFLAPGLYANNLAPSLLPFWLRQAISLLIFATLLLFAEGLRIKVWPLVKQKRFQAASWEDILWLLGPFTLIYFAVLMPRLFHWVIFDRYLLPILPIAITCLLRVHQRWIAPTLPAISTAMLAIVALISIGLTHDWFATNRAQLAAIAEVRASGVPGTEIQGGFAYDGWTQIKDGGYVNEPRMIVPVGAFHPDIRFSMPPAPCRYFWAPYTPAIHPKFTIIFRKVDCLAPSKYPPVHYRTWLPPYNRTIVVQQIPDRINQANIPPGN